MSITVCALFAVQVKQTLYRPWLALWFPRVPTFHGNRHMKVVRLSALSTGLLYPQEIFLVLISVRGWVDPRTILRPEGIRQWKIPMTSSGIEPATFRLVAQCLNQLIHRMPPPLSRYCIKICHDVPSKSKRNLKTLVIPTEIHSRYRPSTNPKAPYSTKYIEKFPVYQQVISFARIQMTVHSCRYVAFLIFVTMATFLQSSEISAADTQKFKLAKHMLVFLYFFLSILPRQRDSSKYFQNML